MLINFITDLIDQGLIHYDWSIEEIQSASVFINDVNQGWSGLTILLSCLSLH